MIQRNLVALSCLFLLIACASEPPAEQPVTEPADSDATPVAEASPGPAYLALHLYNPVSDESHQQLFAELRELNEVVASAGETDTTYTVWKVVGEQAGDYAFLFGSVWADEATYAAVHEHEAYAALQERLDESKPLMEEVYNHYTLLNAPAEPVAPMPEGGTRLAAVHLFDLASADDETRLIGILADLNEAVAAAGHPESRYGVWKVSGEQTGDHAYLMVSVWADRASYDAVHESDGYTATLEEHTEAFETLIPEEIYNKYEPVPLE